MPSFTCDCKQTNMFKKYARSLFSTLARCVNCLMIYRYILPLQSVLTCKSMLARCVTSPLHMFLHTAFAGLTEEEKEEKARAKQALQSDGEGSDEDEGDFRKAATYGTKKTEVLLRLS